MHPKTSKLAGVSHLVGRSARERLVEMHVVVSDESDDRRNAETHSRIPRDCESSEWKQRASASPLAARAGEYLGRSAR